MRQVKVTILNLQLRSILGVTMLVVGLMAGAIAPYLATAQVPASPNSTAKTSFPDTQNNWAQPFINALAQRKIVTGYPDNTFRPEKSVARDEFAAILRQAFDTDPERQIASGSTYKDVPKGYWAANAIEEAYEMGFMDGYPGGVFRPKQPVTKVQVLTSLARKLNLPATDPAAATPAPTTEPRTNMRAKTPMMFPLAIMSLMQPFVTAPANAAAAVTPPTAATGNPPQPPVAIVASKYYQDADRIPQNAVKDVAKTTAAGIVVNYPNRRILNPNKAVTRGELAALIHQALVSQGQITPLPANSATKYIVGR
jgi:S-layer homology domain